MSKSNKSNIIVGANLNKKGIIMADISASLNESLPNNLIASIDFPFTKRIDLDKAGPQAGTLAADEGGMIETQDDQSAVDIEEGEEQFAELLVDAYIESSEHERSRKDISGEADIAVIDLLEPYATNEDGSSRSREDMLATMRADSASAAKVAGFAKRFVKVSLSWVEIRIPSAPNVQLGNPWSINQLKISVRARAKACMRVFGRERCASLTTFWVHFENRRTQIDLIVEQLKISARAKLYDLDFVIRMRIFGIKITIPIGITKFANRYLADQKPVLLDLTGKSFPVPGLGKTYALTSIEVPNSSDATTIGLSGVFR